jgi:pimeloyl-ACP methyl ester carboxylesterase
MRSQTTLAAGAAALTELAIRPATEFGLLLSDPIFWGFGVPRGDGHPVLVLPGLFAGDAYLRPLRGWLARIGYTPVRSGLERNPGWSEEVVNELCQVAERAFDRGGKRVSIVGHSMGGVLARSIAARRPNAIDRVIALGSPLTVSRTVLPENVRMAAIYSHDDTVVRYPRGLARDAGAININVRGSHVGLTSNAEVYGHLGRLLSS